MHPNPKFDFAKINIQPKLKVSQPGDIYEQKRQGSKQGNENVLIRIS